MSSESYTYKGISAGKYVEGEIEAINQEEASFKLKEKKIIITNLVRSKKKKTEKEKKKGGGGFSFGKKKIAPQDVMLFSKQFATMVKAGLPILNVLSMLRDQIEHPTMKDIIEDIRKWVTRDLKADGALWIIGETKQEMGGSLYYRENGWDSDIVPQSDVKRFVKDMNALLDSIESGEVVACHDCSAGGMAIAVVELSLIHI